VIHRVWELPPQWRSPDLRACTKRDSAKKRKTGVYAAAPFIAEKKGGRRNRGMRSGREAMNPPRLQRKNTTKEEKGACGNSSWRKWSHRLRKERRKSPATGRGSLSNTLFHRKTTFGRGRGLGGNTEKDLRVGSLRR